jgi:hypothetical protein
MRDCDDPGMANKKDPADMRDFDHYTLFPKKK